MEEKTQYSDGPLRPATFSLRSLFVLVTVCSVLAALVSLLLHAPDEGGRSLPAFAEFVPIGTLLLLPPFAALAGWLLYGRWPMAIVAGLVAIPFGAVVGALVALPRELLVIQSGIMFGAGGVFILARFLFFRQRRPQ